MKDKKIPKSISATSSEWQKLQEEAEKCGMSLSKWLVLHWKALKKIPPEKRFKIEITTAG